MEDTIIKGTGNSRSIMAPPDLKSRVSSLDDLLDLFISGFACDFGPLNPAGVRVIGTDLNKPNLLSDETAALYGKGTDAVPDDIFVAIRALITASDANANTKAKIAHGTYVGTGGHGVDHPNTLTFPFVPQIVIIGTLVNRFSDNQKMTPLFMLHGAEYGQFAPMGVPSGWRPWEITEWANTTVSWYNPVLNSMDPAFQYNGANITYGYIAIG